MKSIGLFIVSVFSVIVGMSMLEVPVDVSGVKMFVGILCIWAGGYVVSKVE